MPAVNSIKNFIEQGALFVVSHSGGKDSQAMMIKLRRAGVPFIVATARRGLLQMVEERFEKRPEVPSWPSSSTRQCTSDLKRGPIAREARRYATANGFTLVLNCMGFRSEESPARAKRQELTPVKANTTKTRDWFDFLPIQNWTMQDVFTAIAGDGQEPHKAYGAQHFPELADQYIELERKTGYTMHMSRKSLGQLIDEGSQKLIPTVSA